MTWAIALSLLAIIVAGGYLLWDRHRDNQQLDELKSAGLLTVALPSLVGYQVDEVTRLPDDRGIGLRLDYRDGGGSATEAYVLQLSVGFEPDDLCQTLLHAAPELNGAICTVKGSWLTATTDQTGELWHARAKLFPQNLVVVRAGPTELSTEEMTAALEASQLITVTELADRSR